jgi:hypothetical protein
MAGECCQLVGDLDLGFDGCIISINTNCNTELLTSCGEEPLEGATVGSVNITAYADTDLWVGCPSKAGVSIPFIRKYDCVEDVVYFIFNGQGQSFYTGEANRYVSLNYQVDARCTSISASSTGGPAAIYSQTTQVNGYGMSYGGEPLSFSTTPEGTEISLPGVLSGPTYYLQNFSFEASPGQLPTVTYSLVYSFNGGA